jgi:hypothetical protein
MKWRLGRPSTNSGIVVSGTAVLDMQIDSSSSAVGTYC